MSILFCCKLRKKKKKKKKKKIQYNLNGSNTDGSFTVDDSNFFQSLQNSSNSSRKQMFRDLFSYFIMKLYVVYTH